MNEKLQVIQLLLMIEIAERVGLKRSNLVQIAKREGEAMLGEILAKETSYAPTDKPNTHANRPSQYNPKFDHRAGISYDHSVIRTSTPSLEELNAPDFQPGTDPL